MISKKIILVGDFATGKTSLIRRFVDNQFSDTYLSTIGVKISKKLVTLPSDVEVQCMIWDIEGGTESKPVNSTYFTGAHGAILVADVTREETIAHLLDYMSILDEKHTDIPVVIALNKSDKLSKTLLEPIVFQATQTYEKRVVKIFSTSAKTGEGVEEMFLTLAKAIVEG